MNGRNEYDVLVVCPMSDSGPGRYFSTLVTELLNQGYKLKVVSPLTSTSIPYTNCIEKEKYIFNNKKFPIKSIIFILKNNIKYIIKMYQIYPSLLDLFLGVFSGIFQFKYAYRIAGSDWVDFYREKYRSCSSIKKKIVARIIDISWKFIFKNVSVIITDKDTYIKYKELYNLDLERFVYYKTPLDLTHLKELHNRTNNKNKKMCKEKRVVFVGRIDYGKGLEVLIEAIKEISREDIRLTIVGDGPLRLKYEKLVHKLKLAEIIRFVGRLPRAQAFEVMLNSDVIVNPVQWGAGVGYVTIEALYSGRPTIVGRANSQFEELGKLKVAIVVDSRNPKHLAEIIEYLIENPKEGKKIGAIAKRFVVKRRSFESHIRDVWIKAFDIMFS